MQAPVYSMFRRKLGAADKYLTSRGKRTLGEKTGDMHLKLVVTHRKKRKRIYQRNECALDNIACDLTDIVRHTQQGLFSLKQLVEQR